jgi:hypothetical protein
MDHIALLSKEWQTLQNQHAQYERSALQIKMVCLTVYAFVLATGLATPVIGVLVALFWLQEGMFKTFQNRLGERLLSIERRLVMTPVPPSTAMQLHSEWLVNRRGGVALLGEYMASALRPTVAFPYLPLMMILVLIEIMNGISG